MINKPKRRAGWFGGSFTLSVNSKGYIPVVAVTPDYPPLPPSTKAYPFMDTRAYASFTKSMDFRLNPFKPVLLESMKSEKAQYRLMAANELGMIGAEAKYAVGPLIHNLKDKDATVRKYSAETLGKIGYNAVDAVPALIAALNDEDERVRLKTIDALGSIGIAGDDVLSALTALLTDKNSSVQTHAVTSLTKFGPKAKAAVPILKNILGQKGISKYFRSDVKYALKKIDPDSLGETSTQ
jgi:HEAT repeat protein